MLVIRPIEKNDFNDLKQIAIDSGNGFTSLPNDDPRLKEKIEHSQNSIESEFTQRGQESYLFVLEDTDSGNIVGTTGIEASVGLSTPLYHYRISTSVHSSSKFNVQKQLQLLTVCNDYTGVSEICTLYLNPDYRQGKSGRLLSKVRFMFMADHPERFSNRVIAEMRGETNDNAEPPFWQWLQNHFFNIPFAQADRLVGSGKKQFIAELMPQYPIYLNTLPAEAQAVVGNVHANTKPALRLLEQEGFRYRGYVDLFDAGPTVEADLHNIKSVRDSFIANVTVSQQGVNASSQLDSNTYAICNQSVAQFRAAVSTELQITNTANDQHNVLLSPELASALNVKDGETVRLLKL